MNFVSEKGLESDYLMGGSEENFPSGRMADMSGAAPGLADRSGKSGAGARSLRGGGLDFLADGEVRVTRYSVCADVEPFSELLTVRDENGRICGKSLVLQPKDHQLRYEYDAGGRLVRVSKDERVIEHYRYGKYGERLLAETVGAGIRAFEYGEGLRLLRAGEVRYSYDCAGRLIMKNDRGQITGYEYCPDGRLSQVRLPDGRRISYIVDPMGRRVARQVNGRTVETYLWNAEGRLSVALDEHGLRREFCYDADGDPLAMRWNGKEYFLAADQVGTIYMVADRAGNEVKRIISDSFGNTMVDTNERMQLPLGFAAALRDPDSGLLHMGLREYDPAVGRFTTPDPLGEAGGDVDLYGYCWDDPVNFVDRSGLRGISVEDDNGIFAWGFGRDSSTESDITEVTKVPDRDQESGSPKVKIIEDDIYRSVDGDDVIRKSPIEADDEPEDAGDDNAGNAVNDDPEDSERDSSPDDVSEDGESGVTPDENDDNGEYSGESSSGTGEGGSGSKAGPESESGNSDKSDNSGNGNSTSEDKGNEGEQDAPEKSKSTYEKITDGLSKSAGKISKGVEGLGAKSADGVKKAVDKGAEAAGEAFRKGLEAAGEASQEVADQYRNNESFRNAFNAAIAAGMAPKAAAAYAVGGGAAIADAYRTMMQIGAARAASVPGAEMIIKEGYDFATAQDPSSLPARSAGGQLGGLYSGRQDFVDNIEQLYKATKSKLGKKSDETKGKNQ